MTQYKIKPRVKFYFFGIFSRILYDLVIETDDYESEIKHSNLWKKVIRSYSDLKSAEKELKRRQNLTN